MRLFTYLFGFFYIINVPAQNYRQDLLAMNNNLLGRSSYSIELKYQLFVDNKMDKALQERTTKIERHGENMHLKHSSGVEIIETKSVELLFDHRNKIFSGKIKEPAEKTNADDKKEMINMFSTYVDTLLNVYESVKVISEDVNTVKYQCIPKVSDEVSLVIVEVDKKLKVFRSVTTQYKEKRKIKELDNKEHTVTVKIEYRGFNANPVFGVDTFDINRFVVFQNQQISGPSKRYINYTNLNANP